MAQPFSRKVTRTLSLSRTLLQSQVFDFQAPISLTFRGAFFQTKNSTDWRCLLLVQSVLTLMISTYPRLPAD